MKGADLLTGEATELLYEAVSDPSLWQTATAALARAMGAGTAVLHIYPGATASLPMVVGLHGLNEATVELYGREYHQHDFLAASLRTAPAGQVVHGEHLMSVSEFEHSVFWNDYCKPMLDGWHGLAASFQGGSGAVLLTRPRRARDFSSRDAGRLTQLAGHAARAIRLARMLDGRALTEAAFATMPPALVMQSNGRLIQANAEAEALCLRASIRLARAGQALPDLPERAELLRLAVRAASRDGGGTLRLAGGIGITVQPMPSPFDGYVLVALRLPLASDSAWVPPSDLGLTAAEAALAVLLADGARPMEAAAARGVAISTVRTQIRSLMQKTETSSLAGLMTSLAVMRRR